MQVRFAIDALGQQVVIAGVDTAQTVVFVYESAGGVDQDFRANRERFSTYLVPYLGFPAPGGGVYGAAGSDIVCRNATLVHRAAHEVEDEARIVIVQEGVRVLDTGAAVIRID
jgi:hypothetical protein